MPYNCVADVIALVADGITTYFVEYRLMLLPCLAFYVVDVITTVVDGIATQGELIVMNVMCGRWNDHCQQFMSIVVL